MVRRFTQEQIDSAAGVPPPGRYVARVKSAEAKRSKKGDEMYVVTFVLDRNSAKLCVDYVMVEGDGLGVGIKKLQALGGARRNEHGEWEIDEAEDLVGLRAELAIFHEEFNGRKQAKINQKAPGTAFGYVAIGSEPGTPPPPHNDLPIDDEDSMPF